MFLSFPLWMTLHGYCRQGLVKDKLERDDTTGLIRDGVRECGTGEMEGKKAGKESEQSQGSVMSPSESTSPLIYSAGLLRTSQHTHSHGCMCVRTRGDTHMEVCISCGGQEGVKTHTLACQLFLNWVKTIWIRVQGSYLDINMYIASLCVNLFHFFICSSPVFFSPPVLVKSQNKM